MVYSLLTSGDLNFAAFHPELQAMFMSRPPDLRKGGVAGIFPPETNRRASNWLSFWRNLDKIKAYIQ